MTSTNPFGGKAGERSAARNAAQPYYFTGRPCTHGHVADRLTSSGVCTACMASYGRRQYAKSPEAHRRANRKSYARRADWVNAAHSNFLQNNPAYGASRAALRYAQKKLSMPSWLTQNHILEMKAVYERASQITIDTGIEHEVDHIIPLQGNGVCGLHVPWNLQILTAIKNRQKSNHYDPDGLTRD